MVYYPSWLISPNIRTKMFNIRTKMFSIVPGIGVRLKNSVKVTSIFT